MEALIEKMMEMMTDKVLCACVCVFLLAYESYLLSVVFIYILTGASLFLV